MNSRVHRKFIIYDYEGDYRESIKLKNKINNKTCEYKHERKQIANSSKNEPEREITNIRNLIRSAYLYMLD